MPLSRASTDIPVNPAFLPPLLRFEDSRPVQTLEDWAERRGETARLLGETMAGTFPAEPPRVAAVRTLRESVDGESRKRHIEAIYTTPSGPLAMDFWVWAPLGEGPFPLLMVAPRFYQLPWAKDALARGCMAVLYPGVDSHHTEEDYPGYETKWEQWRAAYPEATWTEIPVKAWLAGRVLDVLLDPAHGFSVDAERIGTIGHSRYGKQAILAASYDPRITAVVSRSCGSPTSAPYRFSDYPTGGETPEGFPDEWWLPGLRDYVGRELELPMEGHGWLAMIAPRPCMLHVAHNDDGGSTFAVEQTYRAAHEVYTFLGAPDALHLHYRTGGHNSPGPEPIPPEDRKADLDWFDQAFGRSGKESTAFDTRLLHGLDWQSWRAQQLSADLAPPPEETPLDRRIRWMLGEPVCRGSWMGEYTLQSEDGQFKQSFDRDRLANPAVRRIPVAFGHGVKGDVYAPKGADGPLPAIVWLHGLNYASGYGLGYSPFIPWGNAAGDSPFNYWAQHGFLVLAFDQCGFGTRLLEGADFYDKHPHGSRLGRMVEDARAAVDFLQEGAGVAKQQLPPIDPGRIVLTGYSVGGAVALHAAAMDPRIGAVASVCGFTPMRTGTDINPTGGNRLLYETHALLPKLGVFAGREHAVPYDYGDVIAAVAPRPCLLYTPRQDRHADQEAIVRCVEEVRAMWETHDRQEELRHETPAGSNRFQRNAYVAVCSWLCEVVCKRA